MLIFTNPETDQSIEAAPDLWRPVGGRPWQLAQNRTFVSADIDSGEFSLWRYRNALSVDLSDTAWRATTLGEGATALVRGRGEDASVLFKMEFAMPTLSFKDRGVSVMLAQALEWGVDRVVVDSSGNAATSVAAYAARLEMRADVFVPGTTSDGKLMQIAAHGATIHKVDGSREDTADATHDFLETANGFYASHVYNPLFHQGTKTMIYEIWEQNGTDLPDTIYLPVGNGTMFIGAVLAIEELVKAGFIPEPPEIIAVQSSACAPLAAALDAGGHQVDPVENTGTIAEGIAIAAPARGAEIIEAIRRLQGRIVTVDDAAVMAARKRLAAKGFFVEPTAAVCYAAYRQSPPNGDVLIPLCGAGLKSPKM